MPPRNRFLPCIVSVALLCGGGAAHAGSEMRAGGKLLLTNGVSTVDGASGGGLATWSLIAGNETRDGIGGAVHATYAPLADYSLTSTGAAIGLYDRVELSYARERFDTRRMGAALGLGAGYRFHEDVLGAKLRLLGDAVYDQDSALPQISIGVQYKHADRGGVIHAIGGAHADGTDFTLSATKLFLRRSVIIATSLRMTKANQFGLLGFGGDRHDRYAPQFEGSAGYLLTRRLVVGAEVRTKPDNLAFAPEQDAYDVFAAYAVKRNVSLTAAYVDLGSIATADAQRGAFLSVQASF